MYTDTYMGKKVELNENRNNMAIKVHLLPEEKMREIGFTDHNPTTWYFCKYGMGGDDDISFNLSIKKDNPSDWKIDILDENFLQPYDYQMMIAQRTRNDLPFAVQKDVEKWMQYLEDADILSGHIYGEYI